MASFKADVTAVTAPDWLMEALQDLSVLIAFISGSQGNSEIKTTSAPSCRNRADCRRVGASSVLLFSIP
jgi:hypothetical protein